MRVGCSITPLLTRVSFKNVFMLTLYVGIKLCKAIIRIITAFLFFLEKMFCKYISSENRMEYISMYTINNKVF